MAKGLLLASMNFKNAAEDEFNKWYNEEHIPMLSAVSGVLCARRFRATDSPLKYVALHHVAAPEVGSSDAWKKAANTPWTEHMRPHMRDHLRIVCKAYQRQAS
jgi:hypothetical protein